MAVRTQRSMLTWRERQRRRVLASLVPVKARIPSDEVSLTDYDTPSALLPHQNQIPDDESGMTHDRQVIKAQVLSNVDTVDVAQVMSTRIEDTQQQWIDHQQERFRIQLQRSQTANSTRQSSPQSTSSIHPKERQATSQHASLRQLDHIERLLRTAGESFPSSSTEASDYLVATQCYSMALEQLATMVRSLASQSPG